MRICIGTGMIVALAVVGLAAGLSAQSAPDLPPDQPITLSQAIAYALANHASVTSAQRELAAAGADVRGVRSAYFPQITADSSYSRRGYEGGQTGSGLRRTGDFTDRQTVIGISQMVLDGGQTRTALRQASASEQMAAADLDLARQDRVLAVTVAYFEALRARRLASISTEAVTEAEQQRALIQARIDAGDAAPVDVYPAEVQLANARVEQVAAQNNARVAATALRNQMGLGPGPELTLVDVEGPAPEPPKMADAVSAALRSRPEIARSAAGIERQRAALSLSRYQTLPIPTASATYDRGLAGNGFDTQWFAGVTVTMNIFDGGAAIQGVKSNRARLEALTLDDAQLRKDIAAEVESARLDLASALERLTASQASLTLAGKNLEVAREEYAQGLAIPLEVTTALVEEVRARANYAQALYDSHISRAQLDRAMGRRIEGS